MDSVYGILVRVSKVLNVIGGTALTFMMFLTVADVIGRAGGHPIIGTYEVVGLSLALVIGFGIPKVSLSRNHIYMEVLVDRLPKAARAVMHTFTRILCIILFALIAYNLFSVGNEFHASGEVTSTIKLPFFPVAYGVGVCCFLECLVFMALSHFKWVILFC
ncbi:MAG: Tripartite ATP-independent periplasmic transporter [Syntrophorhabdus sp. PtaU1.Bin002]|nr:MAG: Tripartite ATP-independent periplasmic transporter [Syntrophorhabdus sp. PtaU1.Bin002]